MSGAMGWMIVCWEDWCAADKIKPANVIDGGDYTTSGAKPMFSKKNLVLIIMDSGNSSRMLSLFTWVSVPNVNKRRISRRVSISF